MYFVFSTPVTPKFTFQENRYFLAVAMPFLFKNKRPLTRCKVKQTSRLSDYENVVVVSIYGMNLMMMNCRAHIVGKETMGKELQCVVAFFGQLRDKVSVKLKEIVGPIERSMKDLVKIAQYKVRIRESSDNKDIYRI